MIVGNPTRDYDATTAVVLSAGNYSLGGFIGGQGATVNQTAGTFSLADAGSRTVTATLGAGNFAATGGANLANYLLPTSASGSGTINQKTLTGAVVGDPTRTYDGTNSAFLGSNNFSLNGFTAGQGCDGQSSGR